MIRHILPAACAVAVATLTACIDTSDNSGIGRNEVTLGDTMPGELDPSVAITSGKVVFTEINTKSQYTFALPMYDPFLVPDGLYNIDAQAVASDSEGAIYNLRATRSSVSLTSASNVDLDWFYFIPSSSLVFSDIYVVGSLNATATGGLRDSYFRIYNNSDETVYADGLGLVESCFVNSKTNTYEILTPENDRQKNFTVGTVWVIPGDGTQYPIEPGQSIKIVDQAFNWGAEVAGALDHSDADFEWVDDHAQDTDNPAIANLEKWFCYSNTIAIVSNQANRSYALVRFPEGMTAEDYLHDYFGPFDYISTIGAYMRNEKAYLIPNSWIVDGVNLGNDETYVYGALGDAVDVSYAAASTINKDPERFGKVLRRKVASVLDDGRVIYKDTNDSTNDFELVKL